MTSSEESAYRVGYERLTKEIQAHAGVKADRMMQDVQRSFRTWHQRSTELRALLHHAETDEDMQVELMQNVRPQIARDRYVSDIDSALNAYLGAMGALIDVARRVSQNLPQAFQTDYAERSQAVRDLDGVMVLRDLRNYMLHYSSAPWHFSGTFNTSGSTARVALDSETLAEWKSWKADSRSYFEAHDVVHLSQIIAPYELAMIGLFEWFSHEFYTYKQSDVDAANDLMRRANLQLTGGVTDGHDWQERIAHVQENIHRHKAGEAQINYETGLPFPEQT